MTHDQEEALAVSDRIIVMSNARIAQIGHAARALRSSRPTSSWRISSATPTFSTGVLGEPEGNLARVQIGALSVRLPHRGVPAGSVKLAVRPDAIVLNEAAASATSIRGTVTKASYLGTQMEYEVESPVGDICSSCNMAAVTPSRPARPWRFP